jgi:hypothetical protein
MKNRIIKRGILSCGGEKYEKRMRHREKKRRWKKGVNKS